MIIFLSQKERARQHEVVSAIRELPCPRRPSSKTKDAGAKRFDRTRRYRTVGIQLSCYYVPDRAGEKANKRNLVRAASGFRQRTRSKQHQLLKFFSSDLAIPMYTKWIAKMTSARFDFSSYN